MLSTIKDYLYLLILLPGLIGLIRWKHMDPAFRVFVYLVWIGCANELLATYLVLQGFTTVVNNNLYMFIESFCMLFFFTKLGLFEKQRVLLVALATAFATTFIFETLVLKKFTMLNSYFIILYSFVSVLMSVSAINHLLVNGRTNLLTHPVFIICIGFIVYFTQIVLVHSFWLYGLTSSRTFWVNINHITIFANFFANLTYAIGLLWIPKKLPSLLPS